jgi:hypothetical protein
VAGHHLVDGKACRAEDIEVALQIVADRRGVGLSRVEFEKSKVAADVSAVLAEIEGSRSAPPEVTLAVLVDSEPVVTTEEAEAIAAPWSYLEPPEVAALTEVACSDVVIAPEDAALDLPAPDAEPAPETKRPRTRKP